MSTHHALAADRAKQENSESLHACEDNFCAIGFAGSAAAKTHVLKEVNSMLLSVDKALWLAGS